MRRPTRESIIAEETSRFAALTRADLLERIRGFVYFDYVPSTGRFSGPGQSLRQTTAFQRLTLALEQGKFDAGTESIDPYLGEFLQAESQLGGTGRPELLEHDTQLIAMLKALALGASRGKGASDG